MSLTRRSQSTCARTRMIASNFRRPISRDSGCRSSSVLSQKFADEVVQSSRRARADVSATQASGHTTPLCASVWECRPTTRPVPSRIRTGSRFFFVRVSRSISTCAEVGRSTSCVAARGRRRRRRSTPRACAGPRRGRRARGWSPLAHRRRHATTTGADGAGCYGGNDVRRGGGALLAASDATQRPLSALRPYGPTRTKTYVAVASMVAVAL